MLKNAYLDAKIGVDTAENEPSKNQATKDMSGGWRMRVALAQVQHQRFF